MDTVSTPVSRAARVTNAGRVWVVIRSFALAILLAFVVSSPSMTSAHTPSGGSDPNPMRWGPVPG